MREFMARSGVRWSLAALALTLGCGASTRMVHQSSYYFERCHAADLDEQRTVDERQACWAAWLRHWSSAQPPVRVRYAERRLAALSRGEAMAPLPHEAALPVDTSDAPPTEAQVLVEASTSGGPPHVEVTPGTPATEAQPVEAATETTPARAPVATAPDTPVTGDPYTPPRPAPPPPPVREIQPAPPPRAPIVAGTHPCTALCNPRWDLCVRRCGPRGTPCVAACRSEYRVCTGACR